MSRDLGKYPGCIISGESVTPAQAREIIVRTDHSRLDFSYTGNISEQLAKRYRAILNQPLFCSKKMNFQETEDWTERVQEKYKILTLSYMQTDRILSAFIDGPNGWIDEHGVIYSNRCIGKYPEIEEIEEDWKKIAAAFPYLKLSCQISSEYGLDDRPTYEIQVENGEVKLLEGNEIKKVLPEIIEEKPLMAQALIVINQNPDFREVGVSPEELKVWLKDLETKC